MEKDDMLFIGLFHFSAFVIFGEWPLGLVMPICGFRHQEKFETKSLKTS